VGNNYEITAKDKYTTVDEDMNVTVGGNVISTVTGGRTEKAGSLEITSDDEVSITSEGAVSITAPTVFINGNLAVSGITTVGDKTIISGSHVRSGTMSVSNVVPGIGQSLTAAVAVPPAVPVIANSFVIGGFTAALDAPNQGLNQGISLLSENLSALRDLEKSLQSAEEELDKWTDLEAEIGSRLGALELQYGIE